MRVVIIIDYNICALLIGSIHQYHLLPISEQENVTRKGRI